MYFLLSFFPAAAPWLGPLSPNKPTIAALPGAAYRSIDRSLQMVHHDAPVQRHTIRSVEDKVTEWGGVSRKKK